MVGPEKRLHEIQKYLRTIFAKQESFLLKKKKKKRKEHFCPSVLHRSKKMLDDLFSIYRGENECFVYSFHCESEGHLYALEM